MKIIKRDGTIVNYDPDKIITAIGKANMEVNEEKRVSIEDINKIVSYIESLDKKRMLVEDIQDIIEKKLMEFGKYDLAKKYIVYRYTRALVRKKNSMDESILGLIKRNYEQVKHIDPNKNAVLASTQRDLIAGEVSKDLTKRILLPTKISKAHDDGELYFHDSDYFLQSMIDCSYLDLGSMLENTTVINDKLIETPKTFLVACLVTTQIIDSIACNQYGGVSIDVSCLSKYLFKSKEKIKAEMKSIEEISISLFEELVNERFKYELSSGIQLIQYQLNTLMTTNGQYPSVTLFLNLNEKDLYINETAIIIEEILNQRKQGIKNGNGEYISPRFPKLVYVLNDDNTFLGGKYDYLTTLAMKCSQKSGYPDYISSKVMKKNYKNNIFPPIGDNLFLLPYQEEDKYKYVGRFNQGRVTLNLAQIAILSQDNENKFWNLLDERLELAKEALMCKHYSLLNTTADTSPLHWIHGGISRLTNGDYIDSLLNEGYSNLSLGFIGLTEVVKLLKNTSAGTQEGHQFAIKILRRIRNTIDKWKKNTGIGFSLYAGEDINVSYYFASNDKKKFGCIEGVTDKGYYSDSYSIYSKELSLEDRLLLEKDFVSFCNGGNYHKIDISKLDNEKNYIEMIKFIYDNLLYSIFSTKHDECKVCGYKGTMINTTKHIYECPNCSNKDKTKFNIYKRLTE